MLFRSHEEGRDRRGGLLVGRADGSVRRTPARSCVACRTVRPKRELVRIVRRPDGSVALDPTGRAPGRGAYVCDDERCIAGAVGKGGLGRALRTPIPAGVRDGLTMTNEGGAGGQE